MAFSPCSRQRVDLALGLPLASVYAQTIWTQVMDVLLASTSPRRAALLRQLGLEIDIAAPDVDESHIAGESPAAYVTRLSRMKWAVAVTGLPAVAADTAVIIGGTILGKPESREHAARMLGRLAGETHEVVSGVTVGVPGGSAETFLSLIHI